MMKEFKILNLYAGIGGNRRLWPKEVAGRKVVIVAVEKNPVIAAIYRVLYPDDIVIEGDAHQYLLEHYGEFDFIWASPVCITHSKMRNLIGVSCGRAKPVYFDASLWQEIIFLKIYCKCDWVIENVIPYYKPLVAPDFKIQRHLFWSNKFILGAYFEPDNLEFATINDLQKNVGINLDAFHSEIQAASLRKSQILKNCVKPELGLYIFEQVSEFRRAS